MKKLLLSMSLMCVCGVVQAEEYTTLTVSENGQANTEAAATPAGDNAAPAPPPAPAAAPAPVVVDPMCASVACSGQGTCTVKDGRPMCACNAGFMPGGADGLSCLPYTPPAAVLASPAYADPEREAALKQFYSVMPNHPAERDYARYARLKQYGRFTGTFPDYMSHKFQGQKAGGIAMIAVGAALTGGAAAFLAVGFNVDSIMGCYYDDYYYYNYSDDVGSHCHEGAQVAFLTFGSLFAIASVVMYSVGIPSLVVGASHKKKMDQLSGGRPAASRPALGDFRLSFLQDPASGTYGLGAGFRF